MLCRVTYRNSKNARHEPSSYAKRQHIPPEPKLNPESAREQESTASSWAWHLLNWARLVGTPASIEDPVADTKVNPHILLSGVESEDTGVQIFEQCRSSPALTSLTYRWRIEIL